MAIRISAYWLGEDARAGRSRELADALEAVGEEPDDADEGVDDHDDVRQLRAAALPKRVLIHSAPVITLERRSQAREYVITQPDTPLPWINYLGCEAYFGIISNTAGGYSFYRDARLRRLTRYRYNNVPFDFGGRYIYCATTSGRVLVALLAAHAHEAEGLQCRHGMGYTTIGSTYNGIEAQHPLLRAARREPGNLAAHGDQSPRDKPGEALGLLQHRVLPVGRAGRRHQLPAQLQHRPGGVEDGVIYHKTEYRERRDHFAYFACSEKLPAFDTQREAFLGRYRGWDKPAAVEARRKSTNSIAHGWSPIGSHQVKLEFAARRDAGRSSSCSATTRIPVDQKFDPPARRPSTRRRSSRSSRSTSTPANADAAFEQLRAYWDEPARHLPGDTPDIHTNRMVNIWNAYQCMATFNMSRSASFYESGIGRGLGFRDSNQDLLGFVHMVPARARERILDLAATQLPPAARITSTSRSPSAATTTSAAASTTIRTG
jgi:cellobiose phosphorylase